MNPSVLPLRRLALALAWLAPVAAPALGSSNGPELSESGNRVAVLWQGDKIVELLGGRYLRFRSEGNNARWIGSTSSKIDLAWAHEGVGDYVFVRKSFHATGDGFVLEIEAEKPSVHGRVLTQLEGRILTPELGFKYTLNAKLTAAQKEWRERAGNARRRAPGDSLSLEPFDPWINRIAPSENFTPHAVPGAEELYDGFVVSHDGQNWQFVPKIPVPNVIRPGGYPVGNWNTERPGRPGFRIGIVDRREGGWVSELLEASAPLKIGVCWMFYDLHHNLSGAVPPWSGGPETFEVHYAIAFTPISPAQARDLLARAQPIEWRSLPEYQLPVFNRYSTFDRLISRNSEYAWFATSYDCAVDPATGCDDHYSIRIQHDQPEQRSAWYAWTWGPCFDTLAALNGAYRFSVMVKTQDCTAPFRLAVAEFLHDLWPLPDGSLDSPKNGMWAQVADQQVRWHYSAQTVTGTTGWTRVTLDLPIDNSPFKPIAAEYVRRGVVLQYQGRGTIWFDNVRIDKIE